MVESSLPPEPPDLTQAQKVDLSRLWLAQVRQIMDVRPSSEAANLKASLNDHIYRFAVRLHFFFVTAIERKWNDRRQTNDDNNDLPTANDDDNDQLNNFDCVDFFTRLVVSSSSSSTSSSVENTVHLMEGRRVVPLHHEEFLTALNQFELQGETPSDDFIRRLSYGAFLYHMPTQALAAIGSAMGLAVATMWRRTSSQNDSTKLDRFLDSCQFIARFVHVLPQVQMMDIKTGLVGKFLSLKASVVKARPKRLRVATADFICSKCGTLITHGFEQGRYSVPSKCITVNCKAKTFTMIQSSARYVNVQELRLQEAQEESISHAGRTPRQIEVELEHDLVDCCRPGDIVLVACTVQAVNSAVAAGKTGKRAAETSTYKLYLHGHSITTMSETSRRGGHQQGSQVVYTQQQLQSITQLCHADHRYFGLVERRAFPFDLLVRSLCPSIIGHHEVKAGMLLCLLGGTPPASPNSDRGNSIRCNSHLLVVGDPGTFDACVSGTGVVRELPYSETTIFLHSR